MDGAAGVAMASEHRPDLILMDIQLPVLDGYEATRRIKADPALRHIPIIAVTSYALSGDEAKTRAAGCDGYVAKPFSPRQLLAKISEFLRLKDAARCATRPSSSPSTTRRRTSRSCACAWRRNGYEVADRRGRRGRRSRAPRELEPDLILLDVMMPKLDGIAVVRELKARPELCASSRSSW